MQQGGRLASAAVPDVPATARASALDLLDELPVGVVATDEDLLVLWANPRVGELTGVRPVDAIGQALHELAGPDADRVERALREAWTRQEPCLTWFRAQHSDGGRRRVQLRATIARDVDGQPTGLIGSLDDVAAVTHAADPAARAATILQSSSDAVFRITDDSRVFFLNGAAEDLFGDDENARTDARGPVHRGVPAPLRRRDPDPGRAEGDLEGRAHHAGDGRQPDLRRGDPAGRAGRGRPPPRAQRGGPGHDRPAPDRGGLGPPGPARPAHRPPQPGEAPGPPREGLGPGQSGRHPRRPPVLRRRPLQAGQRHPRPRRRRRPALPDRRPHPHRPAAPRPGRPPRR